MLLWKNIVPGPDPPWTVFAIVECPKGSRNKYEISKTANVVVLDRPLHSSVLYPHDYGLIPGTFAQDDDPLDILVLSSVPTRPLTLITTRPVGVLLMEDEMGIDEKILAVSITDPLYGEYEALSEIPHHFLDEIQEFYRTYKHLENKKYAVVKEWKGIKQAHQVISDSIERFKEKYGDIATTNPL